MTHERLTYLLNQYGGQNITGGERAELKMFLDGLQENDLPDGFVQALLDEKPTGKEILHNRLQAEEILKAVLATDKFPGSTAKLKELPVQLPTIAPRNNWLRYAAAVLVIIGAAIIGYLVLPGKNNKGAAKEIVAKSADVAAPQIAK